MSDGNGVTQHRLEDLERRIEHTLSRDLFDAHMKAIEAELRNLTAELERERMQREREAKERGRAETSRRNILYGAVAAAVLSLIGTLLMAGIIALAPETSPGGMP